MAMRDLVTNDASCDSAPNPLGSLANALIGSSSKTQVHLNFDIIVITEMFFPFVADRKAKILLK